MKTADERDWDIMATPIMEKTDEAPCWLVWERRNDGAYLRAIDSSAELAIRHAACIRIDARQSKCQIPDLFIEQTKINHLYEESFYYKKL